MAADSFTVIVTHEHTDFDALASMLGARKLFPEAVPVLPRTLTSLLRQPRRKSPLLPGLGTLFSHRAPKTSS